MRVVDRYDDSSLGPTSSSSIGKNSDDDDEEVESKLNDKNVNNNNTENTPFDSTVDEQSLPIRKGISKFYNGKSKSFASLSDIACTSIKDITKPENPYCRKRKNLLAYNLLNDNKSQRYALPKYPGIPKRPISSSHSTLNFDIGSIDENESNTGTSWSNGSSTPSDSPPASPHMTWRSFPITTPCAHNFCKSCLGSAFEGQEFLRERKRGGRQEFLRERKTGGRQLRTRKNIMKCPSCPMDISEFLQNAKVNTELMGTIETLLRRIDEDEKGADDGEESDTKLAEDEAENDENNNPSEGLIEDDTAATTSKRGRKRKDAVLTQTRSGKFQRLDDDCDGNDSPSSPHNMRFDNDLE